MEEAELRRVLAGRVLAVEAVRPLAFAVAVGALQPPGDRTHIITG